MRAQFAQHEGGNNHGRKARTGSNDAQPQCCLPDGIELVGITNSNGYGHSRDHAATP